jgi:Family of unknown function (DUF5990)
MTSRPKRSKAKKAIHFGAGELRLRLIRENDVPISHELDEPYIFGLQDKKQEIIPGVRRNGKLAFDFSVQVKAGLDPNRPVFGGRFASGPADDRFVYLSWRSVPRGVYINRVKARLSAITWKMIRVAQETNRPLVTDMSDWRLGDPRKHVEWRLAGD